VNNTRPSALVVDDEPDIRELLEITLERMGIASSMAENLANARALLAEGHFNLCLTDMRLPDGNGIDLVEHIQKNYPDTPVAVITARTIRGRTRPIAAADSSESLSSVAAGSFGTTRVWPADRGPISRNAKTRSSS